MRSIIRNTILSLLGSFKKPANNINVLNGHFISRIHNEYKKEEFNWLVNQLKSKGIELINIEEAIHLIKNKKKTKTPLLSFTFDDGFIDCYDSIAPVLSDHNVNALFFINPGYTEGDNAYIDKFNSEVIVTPGKMPMSYAQIKELSDEGFIIGNHTWNHIRLSEYDNIEKEVLDAKSKLEIVTGKTCKYFAWPYGQPSDIRDEQIEFLLKHHDVVFSGTQFEKYNFNRIPNVINRRHFEGGWPISHMNYFLSVEKTY